MLFLFKGLGITALTFIGMEAFSWLIHKYLFHGPLWFIHKSHHGAAHGTWEANDLFSLGFALTAMVLIFVGLEGWTWQFWMGCGISLYGFVYFLVHDILAHRRLKWWRSSNNPYLKAVIRAHKLHHKHLQREDGEAFGLLYVKRKYFSKTIRRG